VELKLQVVETNFPRQFKVFGLASKKYPE